MGKFVRVADIRRDTVAVLPCIVAEHILILRVSRTKHCDLYRILAHLIHHIIDQVKSLLVCQTGYNSDQHHMAVLIQSQFFL